MHSFKMPWLSSCLIIIMKNTYAHLDFHLNVIKAVLPLFESTSARDLRDLLLPKRLFSMG